MNRFLAFLSFVLVSGAFVSGNAQAVPSLDSIKSQEELTQAITALDKQLFDAYNTCNIEKLGTLVTDDLEFYHDKTGLAVGKQPFLDAIKKKAHQTGEQEATGTLNIKHQLQKPDTNKR